MQGRNAFISLCGLTISIYLYFGYFHVDDPKQILLVNKKLQKEKEGIIYNWKDGNSSSKSVTENKDGGKKTREWTSIVVFPQYKNDSLTVVRSKQHVLWNTWLKSNDFVSVGDYYNHCGDDKILIGKFVIVPSEDDRHGIKFRSFLNVTWGESVHSGLMILEMFYAGIRILRMKSDLCTSTKRTLKCPLQAGFHSFAVDFKPPSFTPKGHYQMTAYGETESKQTLACMIAEAFL